MPLVRLPPSSSVVDAAFDAFEAKEWTGPLLTHRSRLGAIRRGRAQNVAQDSKPAPPEPLKRQYPRTYGYNDDNLVREYYDKYAALDMSKDEYDEKREDLRVLLSYIYKNYTNEDGRLDDDEAADMEKAHARMHALQKLGRKRGFTPAQ